eukprot:TRINITY_DN20833_c0_g1_i1.p4 TRINITY_DN20833_c0_g1~~TRINITY_DN20833_c0_g1_i1.p4  ORF type:complete len:103 (-),score=3.80 TRINITY_DN20833_c0_g1_i1:77-385(-)
MARPASAEIEEHRITDDDGAVAGAGAPGAVPVISGSDKRPARRVLPPLPVSTDQQIGLDDIARTVPVFQQSEVPVMALEDAHAIVFDVRLILQVRPQHQLQR